MSLLNLLSSLTLVLTVVHALPKNRGACVVTCDPGNRGFDNLGLYECQQGYECRSNGCGAQCLPVTSVHSTGDKRGSCILLCGESLNRSCLDGYACGGNGCGSECIMKPDYQQPNHCPSFTCDLHCPAGYFRDANGCDHCQCGYTIVTGRRK